MANQQERSFFEAAPYADKQIMRVMGGGMEELKTRNPGMEFSATAYRDDQGNLKFNVVAYRPNERLSLPLEHYAEVTHFDPEGSLLGSLSHKDLDPTSKVVHRIEDDGERWKYYTGDVEEKLPEPTALRDNHRRPFGAALGGLRQKISNSWQALRDRTNSLSVPGIDKVKKGISVGGSHLADVADTSVALVNTGLTWIPGGGGAASRKEVEYKVPPQTMAAYGTVTVALLVGAVGLYQYINKPPVVDASASSKPDRPAVGAPPKACTVDLTSRALAGNWFDNKPLPTPDCATAAPGSADQKVQLPVPVGVPPVELPVWPTLVASEPWPRVFGTPTPTPAPVAEVPVVPTQITNILSRDPQLAVPPRRDDPPVTPSPVVAVLPTPVAVLSPRNGEPLQSPDRVVAVGSPPQVDTQTTEPSKTEGVLKVAGTPKLSAFEKGKDQFIKQTIRIEVGDTLSGKATLPQSVLNNDLLQSEKGWVGPTVVRGKVITKEDFVVDLLGDMLRENHQKGLSTLNPDRLRVGTEIVPEKLLSAQQLKDLDAAMETKDVAEAYELIKKLSLRESQASAVQHWHQNGFNV